MTTWYVVAICLMLIVYASVTFVAVRHEFYEQFDDQLHDDFETAEGSLARTADGRIAWASERHHDADDDADRAVDVWSPNGERVVQSGAAIVLPPIALALSTAPRYESLATDGHRWRTMMATTMVGDRALVVRVARSEDHLRMQLWEILVVLMLGVPLIVALAGIGGYTLARRALTPIDQLSSEARRITAERLHERLSVPNQYDEIGRLAAVINEAFARLEASFGQLRRFTADASHELRTPLAVMRAVGEMGLGATRTSAEYKEAIGSMLEEVDRLTRLVDALLRLSHGDAGTVPLTRERVDLVDLVRDVVSSLAILAEERGQRIVIDAADVLRVQGDRIVLREAIANVLDNAIKYGPQRSQIRVRVDAGPNDAIIAIADQGPGIPLEHRDRVFDRFYRIDEARSRDQGGTGLGLAIAKWAVEANGGRISVDGQGPGSVFRIALPLAATAEIADHEPRTQVMGGHA